MTIANNALTAYPEIKNVIILEHPPRFDAQEQDPLSLKPEFAKYANNLLQQLRFESKFKNKIVLGKHKLNCSEEARIERFFNVENNRCSYTIG